MMVYVAEIKGRGIAAFQADNACLPLWDGVADIRVRQARPDEEARWRASRAKAIRHGDTEGEEEAWFAFLVTLTDPKRR